MLVREVDRASGELGLTGRCVLVAVSGGIDSTVLAHALAEVAPRRDFRLAIGHVNHGLRGAESEGDEQAVRQLAATLGIPVEVGCVDPGRLRTGGSSRERPTLQEAARTLRYRALHAMAASLGAERIATAHSADDQAETVLLRLFRGSGPDGLGGIPESSPDGVVVRPLLRVSRAEIEAYARRAQLSWREDASNRSPDYTRNRLRHDWLPGLAREFNPRLLRVVADLAEAQRRDSEWIEGQVRREAALRLTGDGKWLRIDIKDWAQVPEALARRLLRQALRQCGVGRHVSRVHLRRMGEFLRSGRVGSHIEIPGGLRLLRDAEGCRLGPLASSGVDSSGAC